MSALDDLYDPGALFADDLIDYLFHLTQHVEHGWLQLVTIVDGNCVPYWFEPDQAGLALMIACAKSFPSSTNVYLPIATQAEKLEGGRRGGAADVLDVLALAVDIDVAGDEHKKGGLPPTIDDALSLLADFKHPPTCVIHTGNGLQAQWFFAEPVAAADAQAVVRRFAVTWKVLARRHGWSIDDVGTVEHIFRVPGTYNAKSDPPKSVRVIDKSWERRFSLDDIDEATIDDDLLTPPPRERSNVVRLVGLPGHRFNDRHSLDELLCAAGCVHDHASRNGQRHYRVPHHADERGVTGVTVYDDEDGEHAVIWSAGFAALLGVEQRASLDAFGLFARLQHGGDFTAAARAAAHEEAARDGHSVAGDTKGDADDTDRTHLPEAFWNARPVLGHIRQAAHSRARSGDAVLAVVLARVAALTPPAFALPAIVASRAPLNMFAALVGGPGGGKSSAKAIGCELLACSIDGVADDLPLGSGEGLIELYCDMVPEMVNGKTVSVKRQVRHGAFMFLDEGQALARLGNREGSTLTATLRTAWSGQTLGAANASDHTKRRMPAGSYALGLVIGFQPEMAGELLADAVGGTPQRFVWMLVADPSVPDIAPEWPGVLTWQPPAAPAHGHVKFPATLTVDATITATVRAAALDVSRGIVTSDALNEHANLSRLKIAGLFCVLDQRTHVSVEDWELAGVFMRTSNAVRARVVAHVAIAQRKTEQLYIDRHVAREGAVVDDALAKTIDRMARVIARHVHKAACDGGCDRRCVTQATAGRDRQLAPLEAAIDRAVELHWIRVDGSRVTPGAARPA